MSFVSRERGFGNDSPSTAVDQDAKMRKEDGQRLRVAEPFDFIDDVTLKLRSIEGSVASEKAGAFREILEKMERWKQEQDVDLELERVLYREYMTKMRWLVNDYLGNVSKVKFEDLLEEMESDERLFRRHTNYYENFNGESEVVESPQLHEPIQQDIFFSQANEQFFLTSEQEEAEAIVSNPDVQNLLAGGDDFLSFSVHAEELPQHVKPAPLFTIAVKATGRRGKRSPSEVGMYTTDESDYEESIVSVESSSYESDTDSISTLRDTAEDILELEPLQPEQHPPQAIEQSAATVKEEEQAVELKADTLSINEQSAETIEEEEQLVDLTTDTPNMLNSGDGLLSYLAVAVVPPEFSNHTKNFAQINFNAELLKKLVEHYDKALLSFPLRELEDMIQQRTQLIEHPQYEYSLEDQQLFNRELLTKLRSFEKPKYRYGGILKKNIPVVNRKHHELVDMLQSDSLNPAQLWPFGRYLTDLDLLKCILSDSIAAQHVLRARKPQLVVKRLFFVYISGRVDLRFERDCGFNRHRPAYFGLTDGTYLRFQYGRDVKEVDAARLFSIILEFYDVSQASITLKNHVSYRQSNISSFELLKSTLGAPPIDQNDKIRIKKMIVESPGMMDFLHWFSPKCLTISCDPSVLVDNPSLIPDDVVITCTYVNVDRLMEQCSASVCLKSTATWSRESIFRVLTAHRLCGFIFRPRVILCIGDGCGTTIKIGKEIFESWSRAFEEEYGNIGREVTFSHNSIDNFQLTLY